MDEKIIVDANWKQKSNIIDMVEYWKAGNVNLTMDDLIAETQLLALGDVIPLKWKINCQQFMHEIKQFDGAWVDYLPRADRYNNRKGLSVSTLEGWDHTSVPSLPEARLKSGNHNLADKDFTHLTDVYHKCHSLHPLLNTFLPIGRTFLVQANMGGYFYPHRDSPALPRSVFRIIVFLNNCGENQYDFILDNQRLQIEEGRAYYVNTRKVHRTFSFTDNSIHLIINIPNTLENVYKIVNNLQYTH